MFGFRHTHTQERERERERKGEREGECGRVGELHVETRFSIEKK
jgi:hypothetical protein